MNLLQASFFKNHEGVDELHFTSDNQCFFKEGPAKATARNLGDNEVTTLTRADYDQFMISLGNVGAGNASKVDDNRTALEKAQDQVKEDQEKLAAANEALTAANANKEAILANPESKGPQKSAATNAVNRAAKAVELATEALEASNAALQALNAGPQE